MKFRRKDQVDAWVIQYIDEDPSPPRWVLEAISKGRIVCTLDGITIRGEVGYLGEVLVAEEGSLRSYTLEEFNSMFEKVIV